MNILVTAGVVLLGTLASVFGIYNYLPLDILQFRQPDQLFGSDITTIAGTDTLSSSRAVINTNFSNLNSTKIENSTTSVASITTLGGLTSASALATIGTITTGVWNGTVIGVAYNGTGTTSPTSNQVILGNGTSGLKVVTGFGTNGQFLTSNGAATAPTWQTSAVDQAIDYNFTSSAFRVKNLHASSTAANPITLNGLAYSLNSARQASSTVLMEDGSGNLSFNSTFAQKFYLNTATGAISASQATTTIFAVSVPANTLSTANAISCRLHIPIGSATNNALLKLQASYGGNASSTMLTSNIGGGSGNVYVNNATILLSATGATNTQKLSLSADLYNDATYIQVGTKESTPNIDSTAAQPLILMAQFLVQNGSIPAGQVICTLIR